MFLVGFMATKSLSPDLGHFYGSLPPLVMYAVAFVKAAVRGVMVAALFVPGVFVRGLSRRPSPTPPPLPSPIPFHSPRSFAELHPLVTRGTAAGKPVQSSRGLGAT